MAEIWAENHQSRLKIHTHHLIKLTERILNRLSHPDDTSVSIIVTDASGIQAMNRQYLGRDRPTNVISFPMNEGETIAGDPDYLGDIIISADAAISEGEIYGYTPEEMLLLYVIHGILHLSGYNHEGVDEMEANRMEVKQQELFDALLPDLLRYPLVASQP